MNSMNINFSQPEFISSQLKERLIEKETNSKTDQEINQIIMNSSGYFNQLADSKLDPTKIIQIYSYFIENIQYIPIPPIQCQKIVEIHSIYIQNIKMAKYALKYISYYAFRNSSIEEKILNSMNIDDLHRLLSSSEITQDTFNYLEIFLSFSPNVADFCLKYQLYDDLCKNHEQTNDETQLLYNISLIKIAIKAINRIKTTIFEDFIEYLCQKVDEPIRSIDIHELICWCISQCLVKMPDEINENCLKILLGQTSFHYILMYWIFPNNGIDDLLISIDFSISFICYFICSYHPEILKQQRFVTWIKNHYIKINDQPMKYQNQIDDINTLLIGTLIKLIDFDNYSIDDLIRPKSLDDGLDYSFFNTIFDLLENSNYKMKNLVLKFFEILCNTRNHYMIEYLLSKSIVSHIIEDFEQNDEEPLKSALSGILSLINSISGDFDQNPIIIQLRTDANFDALQRISLNNTNEKIRTLAKNIIDKAFTEK